MAQSNEIDVNQKIVEQTADRVYKMYQQLYQNRERAKREINRYINDLKKIQNIGKIFDEHKSSMSNGFSFDRNNFSSLVLKTQEEIEKQDVVTYQIIKKGYKLIDRIRAYMGLDKIEYQVYIYEKSSEQVYIWNPNVDELLNRTASRGKAKIALQKSNDAIKKIKKSKKTKKQDKTFQRNFFDYFDILKQQASAKGIEINRGYAVESFVSFISKQNNSWGLNLSQANYQILDTYLEQRKNTDSWLKGGDVGKYQIKQIIIDKDNSSASLTSISTIISTLQDLYFVLNEMNNPQNIEGIMKKLGSDFDREGFPKKITKDIQNTFKKKIVDLIK